MTEWNASCYHFVSSMQESMAAEELGRIQFQGNERMIDVGCGDGKITAKIANMVPRGSVLGVDPSHEMIAFAQKNYPADNNPRLEFAVADVRALPFREEFDLVTSFNALHWVPEMDIALNHIFSALKPQGRALLRFVPDGERKSLEDVIEDVRHAPKWADFYRNFRKPYAHFLQDEFGFLARKIGFGVLQLQTQDQAWDFETPEAFLQYCRVTLVEWTRYLPEEKRDDFIQDVLTAYRPIASTNTLEENTFKYYQLSALLQKPSHSA